MKNTLWISLLVFLTQCFAVYDDEAFVIDWVQQYVGVPLKGQIISLNGLVGLSEGLLWKLSSEGSVEWRAEMPNVKSILQWKDRVVVSGQETVQVWNSNGSLVKDLGFSAEQLVATESKLVLVNENKVIEFTEDLSTEKIRPLKGGCLISHVDGEVLVLEEVDKGIAVGSKYIKVPFSEISHVSGSLILFKDRSVYDMMSMDYVSSTSDEKKLGTHSFIEFGSTFVTKDSHTKQFAQVLDVEYKENILVSTPKTSFVLSPLLEPIQETSENVLFFGQEVLLTESDGVISYYVNGKLQWQRDEALNHPNCVSIVPQEPPKQFQEEVEIETGRNFLHAWISRIIGNVGKLFSKNTSQDRDIYGLDPKLVVATESALYSFHTQKGDHQLMWKSSIANLQQVLVSDQMYASTGDGLYTLDPATGAVLDYESTPSHSEILIVEGSLYFRTTSNENGGFMPHRSTKHFYTFEHDENCVRGIHVEGDNADSTWTFNSPDPIISVTSKTPGEMASLGIVLGDDSVLYKYNQPHLLLVFSYDDHKLELVATLLNSVTGEVYHSSRLPDVSDPEIASVVDENFVIFSYYSNGPNSGYRMVVWDLFDSMTPDTRQTPAGGSTFNVSYLPQVSHQSFSISTKIIGMQVSKTKYGITSKTIICFLEDGSLISLPKYVLNSRRFDRLAKDAKILAKEFRMIPYEPAINFSPKWIITHENQLRSRQPFMVSCPTLLESTSVVCSVNGDIFCTTISPSGKFDMLRSNFEKGLLILTMLALLLATGSVRLIANAKKLTAQWCFEI